MMAISSKHVFVLWLIALVMIISNDQSSYYTEAAEPSTRLYVFGDSLYDTGNDLYRKPTSPSGKWPYSMSTGNKTYGRFSDGLVIPDFIAKFGNLSLPPPSLKLSESFHQGANFAYPAASVFDGEPMNLNIQLKGFMSLKDKMTRDRGATETRAVLKKSVFLFSFGGGVYFFYKSSHPKTTTAQKTAYVNTAIAKITDALYVLYLEGGRKFAFQNVMPLGCTPNTVVKDNQCEQQLTEFTTIHNAALIKANERLQTELPGFSYSIFDHYTTLANRLKNPSAYGFKVGMNQACCGRGARRSSSCGTKPYDLCKDPKEYVFWDHAHTSQKANEQLATLFWSGGPDVVKGMNMQKLFQLSPLEQTDDDDHQNNLTLPVEDE